MQFNNIAFPCTWEKSTLKKFQSFLLVFLSYWGITAQSEAILLQAFDWNVHRQPEGQTWFNVIQQNSQRISDAGFDAVWLPPCSDSAAPQGYLPRELYNLNSAYGTEEQLRGLINNLHQKNIKVIGDIVINHRVGSTNAVDFKNPTWPTYFITADDEGRDFVNFPVEFSINGDYFPGNALKADGSNGTYGPARDLDHFNPEVRQEIIKWMRFLKNDVGYDGWRYDFVHGYDPVFNKEYNDATQPYIAVGELLESSRVQTNNWVNFTQQSSSAFDFNTKVSLQNALRDNNLSYLRDFSGNASGMIGINPSKSVTFLDNHDTGAAQQCCGSGYVFPGGEVNLRKGYAYILTHPGNPMVFWTHYFDGNRNLRKAIRDLIAVRKDVKIFAGSTMNIDEARNDLYAAYIDGRNGTLAMKLGSGSWTPNGSGWNLRTSGKSYAVWSKGGSSETPDDTPDDNDNTPGNFTVFVKNFKTAYTWANQQPTLGRWPGTSMTAIGNDWYQIEINSNCTNIIFNNNGRNKTPDLNVCSDKPYYYNNTFNANPPSDFPGQNTASFTVFVKNFKTVYTWENQQATAGDWPGTPLTPIGNDWYKAEINANCSNIIFNNNGRNKTPDLNVCSDKPYYYNNDFRADPPSDFPTNGQKIIDITTIGATAYPNPFTSELTINFNSSTAGTATIQLVNSIGQLVTSKTVQILEGNSSIQLKTPENLSPKGLYFYRILLNNKIFLTGKALKN
ncbi:alpha-amylase family glycosyl hydrolase [Aquimarina agarilytica]|uniref:alpha-amylase family glycosyl hydrolase n=1 Tax=Aquimarina agarilytica TaxID=1087449 RepID=UPI00028A0278|nr:alpha-amylase family glycosyl hydrolase [Aquimarina agarilytica]